MRRNGKVNVENAAELVYFLIIIVKAFEMEIVPARRIVAQIGETLVLTCNTTGCASPSFSWRTQIDSPLGGTVDKQRTYSTLTMNPVSIVNSHSYLCTVFCGEKEKKEKSVKVELYSFPSDPIIEIRSSLVAGEPLVIVCKIPDVYPANRLEVLIKKEEQVLHEQNFFEDDSTNTESKTVTHSFYPTAEDIGKEISCVAMLPIADMDFEPKERVASQKLNANFGPQNTVITAYPGTSTMEEHPLKLTCVTESNPPPQIVWRKQLADESIQHLIENSTFFIPRTHFTDSGLYICEVINLVTNKTEKATVDIVIQGAPNITELSIEPSTTVQEGKNVSIQCSAESNPPPKIILRRKSDSADLGLYSEGRILLPSVTFLNGGDYECVAENKFGRSKSEITLNVECKCLAGFFLSDGPKNTMVSVIPATAVKEGETVTMKCTSSGNPAPVISWKKKKATGESEEISEGATLTIQNVKSEDLGLYQCEAYNQFGKDEKAVTLLVQVPPQNITVLVYPSENVKEGENVTITCSTYSNPPAQMVLKKVHQEKEIILPSVNGTFILYNVTKNDTGRYLLDVFNEVGNKIKVIEIGVVGRLEKPDQMIPLIIAFSSVTAVAVPVAAILIYVSRKAKINGSYSLVKALRLKV
ncbi:PREDICTED: vascular cell adhesion protein 1 [Apaloderma vittatum]|uniref:vascular cell adhesion protein 1 n=1 Tax=Apaloderma vittatum TaxID=57397 RepID=UPI000521AE74|nr:PREDICTED: vascular cell adhesion protein 1 [Apaloderma vittatum]